MAEIYMAKATLRGCVYVCVHDCSSELPAPGGVLCLLLPLQTSLYGVCVLPCGGCLLVCVCLQGPPSWVLIGLALPRWVSDPGQVHFTLAAEGASQSV